jgi:DnaK suppressor protein
VDRWKPERILAQGFERLEKTMDKTHFRARIEAEQQELRMLSDAGRESRAPVVLDQQSVGRLSRMDAMQQQSMDLAREERRKARIAMLAAALRRLDEDEFGYCLACGEHISLQRLEIDPAVTLCVDCQR